MQKTKIEIIEETANFYNLNNRAVFPIKEAFLDIDGCAYILPDGRMCAVGRCLINPEKFYSYLDTGFVSDCSKEFLNSQLKEEYRGHSVNFWQDLQSLHDNQGYWTIDSLSKDGLKQVKFLKEKYKE